MGTADPCNLHHKPRIIEPSLTWIATLNDTVFPSAAIDPPFEPPALDGIAQQTAHSFTQSVVFDEKGELFHRANLTLGPQQSDVSGRFRKAELGGFEKMVNSWCCFPQEYYDCRDVDLAGVARNEVSSQADEFGSHVLNA
jgi:hypothetical protein